MDLASEEPSDLAADREPEACAAVAPARRPVRLLKRLEDQARLVGGDPDPSVDNRERDHAVRACKRLAGELHPRRRLADAERHAAGFRELERVREQVLQHLLEPLRVGQDRRERVLREVELEQQPVLRRHRPERALQRLELVGD